MFEVNEQKILSELKPSDLVLDIGGWACPFNRANWVMDAEPYETRGYYRTYGMVSSQGGNREWFTRDTWVQRDICSKEPFPFADKYFDFVICSHVLEDIRDPLWVCSEMIRVAKRGYIEVPSREWESCRGVERKKMVGCSHHRWLIDIESDRITFLMKLYVIQSHWRFSLPVSHFKQMPPAKKVQGLWWESSNNFEFQERTIHGTDKQCVELERFVQSIHPYSKMRLAMDRNLSLLKFWVMHCLTPRTVLRVVGRFGRLFNRQGQA